MNDSYQSLTLRAVGSLAAFTALLLSGSALAGGDGDDRKGRHSKAEILWDQFGIPHIYGPDRLSVVRGLGYAEMENHAETILMNVASARGRSAEYFGPGEAGANVQNDILVRTEGIPERARAWLESGGEDQAEIVQAFTDGVNEYAKHHGDTIDPSFRRVLPFLPTDVTAHIQYVTHFSFMPDEDNIPALISAWQTGGISAANEVACSFTPGCSSTSKAVARNPLHSGSNGWAISPKKTASGNAILMGNPHMVWGNNQPAPGLGLAQFMEANLVIGDPEYPELNASGVLFAGAPFIAIG
jgi:acyl-homoserine-lactone acylase